MRKFNSRTIHRYLSIVIGVQLLFWSLSGLIFSWNPIKKVRGEHLVHASEPVDLTEFNLVEIQGLIEAEKNRELEGMMPVRVELRMVLDRPVYEVQFVQTNGKQQEAIIFDAETAKQVSPITEELAKEIALADFAEKATVASAELIEDPVGSHSEYRGKELPVWRIELEHSTGTVIYVSANRGTVVTRRNNRWRLFDFFWMLHTMDYQGRDNFNSWTLRLFSIFGVATVLSGYWLWWRSSRLRSRLKKRKNRP